MTAIINGVTWEIGPAANLSEADLRGADLRGANLSEADLRGADLRGANLRWANLSGSDLSEADLREADLSCSDLSEADLRGADLPAGIPVVQHIDAQILRAIDGGGLLDMAEWHGCATTHCRAGWAIALAGEAGASLESIIGPNAAGALIYAASRNTQRVPDWYVTEEQAMTDIRAGAEADPMSLV